MARYLVILSSILALSLSAAALPQGVHNHATATAAAKLPKASISKGGIRPGNPSVHHAPRQIHNADYGSGGGPSGNPGSSPASTDTEPSTPTKQVDYDDDANKSEPTHAATDSEAGQKREYSIVRGSFRW